MLLDPDRKLVKFENLAVLARDFLFDPGELLTPGELCHVNSMFVKARRPQKFFHSQNLNRRGGVENTVFLGSSCLCVTYEWPRLRNNLVMRMRVVNSYRVVLLRPVTIGSVVREPFCSFHRRGSTGEHRPGSMIKEDGISIAAPWRSIKKL